MIRFLFIIMLLSLVCAPAQAEREWAGKRFQDFVRDVWSLESGLPQITVTSIAQGPEGYIWVGTQQGLARFDGVRFTTWVAEEVDALPGNFIYDLHLDSQGRLWVATYKGVALYQQRAFHSIGGPPDVDGRPQEITVWAIDETPNGRILVAAEEGLFEADGHRLKPLPFPDMGPVYSLFSEADGVWLGGLGQFRFLGQDGLSSPHALPKGLEAVQVSGFARHDGELWVGSNDGLFRYSDNRLIPFVPMPEMQGQPVDALYSDDSDTLWVGSNHALLRIHGGVLKEVIDADHPNAHRQIQSIHQDHEGNLWLGSFRDGLARYWAGWTERFNEPQGLHEPLIWSVANADDDGVWVGSNDGLSHLSDELFELVIPGHALPHPHAYTLHQGPEGLWIGTRRGLVLMDPESGELNTPTVFDRLSPYQINGIVPAGPHGRYFFATTAGLFLWRGDDALERVSDRIGSRMVRQVRVEAGGSLLVATNSGLYRGPPDKLTALGERHGLLPGADYSAIHRVDEDLIVLTSIDSGLFARSNDQWQRISVEEGLPTNAAYFVSDDGDGHIWVAGFHGLYRVAVEEVRAVANGRAQAVNAEMILSESGRHIGSQQAYCCNGAGHAKGLMRDDGLWLPTRGGVVRIRPDAIFRNTVPPGMLVEQIYYQDRWHDHQPGQRHELPVGVRDVAFAFTALSFQDPRSIRLEFRVDGYDEQWRSLDNVSQRRADYTNLPPGDYRFQVRGANNAGVWVDEPASLEFRIPPRFHETLWFPLSGLGLLLLLFLLGYRWRVRQLRHRQAQLQGEVNERTEELRIANNRLVEANRALRDASQTDPLTGLRNRRYLYGQMARDLAHFERLRGRLPGDDLVMVFALMDVDHFKQVNDQQGHRAGDLVLKQLGKRLEALVRSGDYVVRWGGEEFLIIFREMARSNTQTIIHRLQKKMGDEAFFIDEDHQVNITVSIGFSEYPLMPETQGRSLSWEAIVDLADHALYQVKNHGRNGWAVVRPGDETDPIEFLRRVRKDLDTALAEGQAILSASWLKQGGQ
ncbi:diguanylate cyclase (GGDEF)-like protein [Natronospira proteinivora]|uniref:diguanylate cyclase n=1 Tax=Natronospira proteinivora TaxID=1807133 RepID=A0ABT1GA34_9GAMM|nr:ligand-binding sensor domain-containing diguanylate cyclase [Natronospira proteinivora]MCP1728181.1 diguanylate cyclase (GGDEF)-like protein [Natronospira proteinivora]